MKTSINFKVLNILATILIITPIILSAPTALAQTSNDGLNETSAEPVYETNFDREIYPDTVVTSSGDANLEWTDELDVEGNENTSGLWVRNRINDYDGIDLPFDALGLEEGTNYIVEVQGVIEENEEVPADSSMNLETVDGYDWLDSQPVVSGEMFILESTYTAFENESDHSFRIKTNPSGSEIEFAVTSIKITETGTSDNDDDEHPSTELFELIDFENGELNGFESRDRNEELIVTTEANNAPEDGGHSLHVSNRQDTHQGPILEVSDYINIGETYEVSVWVKNDSDMTADITLSTQIGDSAPSYDNITSETVSPEDDFVLLQGTQRYDSVGDGYVAIYVESNNADLEFYIDGVDFQEIESTPVDPELDLPSIAEVYGDDFLIGNAASVTEMSGQRLDLMKHHHNLVTAENAMKPDELITNEGEFDFSGANTLVNRVYEEGLELHGHVLVWHSQSPDWHHTDESGQPLPREEALANMQNHIRTVMTNFGPSVKSWDVVNEALDGSWENPEDWQNNLRNTGWRQAIGDDYIYEAFQYARQVADELGREDMILYYNDYNDHVQPKAQTMYHMIKDINEQWAVDNPAEERKLISGVGMQGHYSTNINPDNVKQTIERFEQLDIDIGITELDVTTSTSGEYVEDEIIRQGQVYARLFQIFQEHSDSINRVTFWGLNDGSSWRSDRYPLLFDGQLQAKPAYRAVVNPDGFLEEYPIQEAIDNHNYAVYGTPEIGNDEIDDAWDEAPGLNMNQMQQAHEVAASGVGRVLWDEENLYVLLEVSDSVLDSQAGEAHEQDSVETFINETGEKMTSYINGVGQYRVNYENEATFNPGSYSKGFESVTTLTDSGYVVEMAVPWKDVTPEAGHAIGFDIQINDAIDGQRHGVVAWNDDTGQGFQDPSVFGELTLVEALGDIQPVEIEEDEQTPILPGQTGIVSEGNASVTMPADLPEGTEILVEYIDEDDLPTIEAEDGYTLIVAGEIVQITLTFPGGEEEFEGDYRLTLGVDDEFIEEDVYIYYYNEDTDLWERREAEVTEDTITAEVSNFSLYGVFTVEELDESGPPGELEDPEEPGEKEPDESENVVPPEKTADGSDETEEPTDSENNEDLGKSELPETGADTTYISLGAILLIIGLGLVYYEKKWSN